MYKRQVPDEVHAAGTAPTGPGKRDRRPLGVAAASSHNPKTMTIWDHTSRRYFLVNFGADESVFPATARDQTLPRTQSLAAANSTEIATYGRRDLPYPSPADTASSKPSGSQMWPVPSSGQTFLSIMAC